MTFDSLRARLPGAVLLTEPEEVAAYAADWSSLAILRELRGALTPPAAVLRPASVDDVRAALAWASENRVAVIPAGGRSGVSGGTLADGGELVLDLLGLNRLLDLDEVSGIAHVEAGILGGELELQLARRGFTLGHFPQSVELSTVGGWIAARSAGQLSAGYGAIEDMVVALKVALADGSVATSRLVPRTAAGAQIHELMLGSEGTLGVVVEAWLRVRRAPETREMASLVFDSFGDGLAAVRHIVQAGAAPDAIRLYDDGDTAIVFRGMEPAPSGVVSVMVAEGDGVMAPARLTRALQLAGARPAEQDLAAYWWEHRNDAVQTYRRVLEGALLGPTAAVDTIEVAGIWSGIENLYQGVRAALLTHAQVVGCHCSHAYETGCALYFTFVLNADDREAALAAAWRDALDAAQAAGGTITHHHGVGRIKSPWLARELDGFAPYLARIQAVFDPAGIMNPGTLRT